MMSNADAAPVRATEGLSFSEALRRLKAGDLVARAGWNGKGMWLLLVNPDAYGVGEPGQEWDGVFTVEAGYLRRWGSGSSTGYVDLLPWIGMKTADNKFVPWLASQTDILAEDWIVVK